MSKRVLVITFLMIASFFVACSEEDQVVPEVTQMQAASARTQPIVAVEAFTAPATSEINVEKARLYAKASAGLVELGFRWSERIEKASDSEKIQILNAYNVARDQLCARVGLAGIAEYNWITDVALPDPKNKANFETAGVKASN